MRIRIYYIMKFRNSNILSMNISENSIFESHFLMNESREIDDIQELKDIKELENIKEFEDIEELKDIEILEDIRILLL